MDFARLNEVTAHAGFQYMMDILDGKIISGRITKWMCQRQLDDLKHGSERGLYFSTDHADIFLDTVRTYKHYEGPFAGRYFEPTPPQIFFNWCLFGWLNEDTLYRRFTEVYKEIARKNGKTFEGASTGKYMFSDDGEAGAKCYTVATKKDQAKLAHEDAKAIIMELQKGGDDLDIKILRDNISHLASYSSWTPLGRDSKSEDGLNPHFALLDEVHAMVDSSMYDVIDSAFGGRPQPLFYLITTAGFNLQGPGFERRGYLKKILDPSIDVQDDAVFGAIYTLDMKLDGAKEDDDIWDEKNWEKANPNIPYIPTILPKIQKIARKARESETVKANFQTKHLNIWLSSSAPWIRPEDWACNDGCFGDRDLINQDCYSGLDLASVNDLAALANVFPPKGESISMQRTKYRQDIITEIQYAHKDVDPDKMHLLLDDFEGRIEKDLRKKDYVDPGPYRIIPHFFVPEMNIAKRSKAHGVRYDLWAKDKSCNFHATPGRTIDYSFIEYQVERDAARYNLIELGYDPHNAHSLIANLVNNEIECVEIVQNWSNMSWVSKEFETLVLLAGFAHNKNPVLSWNCNNTVVHLGPSGNYKPDKNKSPEKIDGIIALLMGLNRAISNEDEPPPKGNDGSLLDIDWDDL